MAKKKLKVKIWEGVEITFTSADDRKPLIDILVKAARYERENKHLAVAESYYQIRADIETQIQEQIKND